MPLHVVCRRLLTDWVLVFGLELGLGCGCVVGLVLWFSVVDSDGGSAIVAYFVTIFVCCYFRKLYG